MSIYPHSFEAPVVRHDVCTHRSTVVFLPDALRQALGVQGRVRISGEINGMPVNGAWQPVHGRWYLMLSKPLLRETGARIGHIVFVRFRLDPADTVEMPEALQSAPDAEPDVAALWAARRPGPQRGLAHRVAEATRLLIEGGPYGPPPRATKTPGRPSP